MFNITPKDYEFRTLEWYLIQNAKGAHQSVPPSGPTGVVFAGQDIVAVPGLRGTPLYHTASRLMPPQLFVNGQELYMEEDMQAEVYRQQYFSMPLNKFKKIELKRMVGTLHKPNMDAASENLSVDRFLLYLTLIDDAMMDNPGSLNVDVDGYYDARTFYRPTSNNKPTLADYRTTIH